MHLKEKIVLIILLAVCNECICGKVIYPWRATTAIVKADESFTIWFDSDEGQEIRSIVLCGPYNTITIPSFTKETGFWTYDTISGNTYDTRITVPVPLGTPADRYDLILDTSAGKEVSKRAVKVVKEYKTDYTIMHISDTHFCQGEKIDGFTGRLHKITAFVDFANIIGAEMVFITGDLINNNMFPARKRADFFYNGSLEDDLRGVYDFNAATFSAVGNHDFLEGEMPGTGMYLEKAQTWNMCHGLQFHHFEYGDTRCMVVNTGWNGFDWSYQLDDHVSWLKEAGSGNLRFAAYHKSEAGIMGEWGNKVNLGLAMIGHNHHLAKDNPYDLGGRPIQYYANSVREYLNVNLFRVRNGGSYTVVNNEPIVENPEDDLSKWRPKLILTYAKINDGSSMSNSATLVNKCDIGFTRANIRFVMPKGSKYSVSKGIVEQRFDGDKVHVVDIVVAVEPNSEILIEIKPD